MKLKRYCVTVMDNETPLRYFWTQKGAQRWREKRLNWRQYTFLYKWDEEQKIFTLVRDLI